MGAALLEGKNFPQAKEYLTIALQQDPEMGLAHYNLGLVLVQLGEIEPAVTSFRNAAQYSHNAPEPYYYLGQIYLQQKQTKAAKDALQKAIQINPNYADAHYNLGGIYFAEENLEAALNSFRKVTENNPSYAGAYYAAGLIFIRQGRYDEARQVIEYARDLYTNQNNQQWANKARELLAKIQDL
ncbi:MAG: tetratricopeptide repeat protein [Spirulinaceae cyanobacterium]